MNEFDPNNADSLLEELKNLNKTLKTELIKEKQANEEELTTISATSAVPTPPTPDIVLDEDNLGKFILETSQKIIKNGLETIEALKTTVAFTEDSKAMLGFAEIISATTNAINTLNAINIEKRKAVTAKQLKELDIEARKQLKPAKTVNNTLNLVASREAIVKMLDDIETKRLEPNAIDTNFKEIDNQDNK